MMNPKMILQLKTMMTKFRQNHPKVPMFFSAASRAINEGSVIEISQAQGDFVLAPDNRKPV